MAEQALGSLPNDETERLLQSIYPVSRETMIEIGKMVSLLRQWQQKTNLVAPNTLNDIWSRHVADSLQCLALHGDKKVWADIGSGGGFPGLVIAIVLGNQGPKGAKVHLVESIAKKCSFLRQANRLCGGVAQVHCVRVENVIETLSGIEVLTARALADLNRLLHFGEPLLSNSTIGLFHKGRDYQRELNDCRGLWEFDLILHQSRIEADSRLLEVSQLKRLRF